MKEILHSAVIISAAVVASCSLLLPSKKVGQGIDGIEGESTAKGHEKEIDVESLSWGDHQF